MRFIPLRYVAGAVAVPLMVALQGTLIARLPLPGGGPNLVLVFVVGLLLIVIVIGGIYTGIFTPTCAPCIIGSDVRVVSEPDTSFSQKL